MRATASGLDGVATQIDAILTTLSAAAAGYAGSWGDDEFGKPFAEGDSGYTKRAPTLEGVLSARATRLRQYSSGLRDGAATFDTTEADNTDAFQA